MEEIIVVWKDPKDPRKVLCVGYIKNGRFYLKRQGFLLVDKPKEGEKFSAPKGMQWQSERNEWNLVPIAA